MNLGQFSVEIPQGTEKGDGYVALNHNTRYTIQLANSSNRRCAAEVHVDGKHVGTFRLNAFGSLSLERPSGDNGCFTFYQDGTSEAKAAQLNRVSKQNRGLVSVTFKPEKYRPANEVIEVQPQPRYPYDLKGDESYYEDRPKTHYLSPPIGSANVSNYEPTTYKSRSYVSGQSVSSGGTGLSGQSGQSFRKVGNLDYDESSFVTINLRLVASDLGPRPLRASSRNSTPVPAPVR